MIGVRDALRQVHLGVAPLPVAELGDTRLSTFFPIARIDEGRREVYAVATTENLVTKARAGNGVITFEASQRGFERMQSKAAALGAPGGIVRERWHDDGRDVGRCIVWDPDEDKRQIVVGMHISTGAEETWQKVLDGTLLGVSVGGKILESEMKVTRTEGGGQRLTPTITDIEYDEIILTGSPSDPQCLFQKVYRTGEELDDVVDGTGDLDVARAFSAAARQARAAQQHANAKGPTPTAGKANATSTTSTSGGKFGDKNNFTGKVGDKFVTYVGGKKVGEYDTQAEAEKAYNDAKGPGAASATGTSKTASAVAAGVAKGTATGKAASAGKAVGAGAKAQAAGAAKGSAVKHTADEVARADETHGAFTGTHSHGHAANGAQGDDDTHEHEHEHTHDGDGDHGHGHDDVARAELETLIAAAEALGRPDLRVERRAFSADDRKELADKGHALPDGSYPIPDKDALGRAITLAQSGHGDVAAATALIKKRAKALGATDMLPEEWGGPKEEASVKRNEAAATQTDEQTEERVERTAEEVEAMVVAVAAKLQLPAATIHKLDEAELDHVYRTQVVEPTEAAAAKVEADAEAERVARAEADEAEAERVRKEGADALAAAQAADAAAAGAAGADVHRDGLEEIAIEGAEAAGEDGGDGGSSGDEETDAGIAMQAIEYVNKLIARESAELANGDSTDAADVSSLMWIRDSLLHFAKGELLEALEMKRTIVEALEKLATLTDEVKAYKTLTGDAVARTQTFAEALEKIETERAEVKRSGETLTEELDQLVKRVKTLEDTPIGGPVSKAPTGLDKMFAGDEAEGRTAEQAAAILAAVKRDASPEMLRVIQAQETQEAIRQAHARPQHTPPTRQTMPTH